MKNVLLARFDGVLDISALSDFKAHLSECAKSHCTIRIISLSRVRQPCLQCMSILNVAHKEYVEAGQTLILVPPIRQVPRWGAVEEELSKVGVKLNWVMDDYQALSVAKVPPSVVEYIRSVDEADQIPEDESEEYEEEQDSFLTELHGNFADAISRVLIFGRAAPPEEEAVGPDPIPKKEESPLPPKAEPKIQEHTLIQEVMQGFAYWWSQICGLFAEIFEAIVYWCSKVVKR